MAAFRLARRAGDDFDTAYAYAEKVLHDTHYDYSQWNRARLMRGDVARVVFQFKQYALGTTWLLTRNFLWTVREFLKAAKGEQSVKDAFRSEAYKTLAGIMGMQMVFAGALGLPFVGGIALAVNLAAKGFADDDDEPFEFEVWFRRWAAETFGVEAGNALGKGLFPWAVGQIPGVPAVDLQGKLSMADLWWREPDRELEGNDAAVFWGTQFMGPTAQLFVNAFATAKLWGDGHPWRAVEKIMPLKAVADLMKAYRYAAEGATTLNGDALVEEVNAAEVFATALGFPPMRISERYAENQGFVNASKALHERRQEIMDQVAHG